MELVQLVFVRVEVDGGEPTPDVGRERDRLFAPSAGSVTCADAQPDSGLVIADRVEGQVAEAFAVVAPSPVSRQREPKMTSDSLSSRARGRHNHETSAADGSGASSSWLAGSLPTELGA